MPHGLESCQYSSRQSPHGYDTVATHGNSVSETSHTRVTRSVSHGSILDVIPNTNTHPEPASACPQPGTLHLLGHFWKNIRFKLGAAIQVKDTNFAYSRLHL